MRDRKSLTVSAKMDMIMIEGKDCQQIYRVTTLRYENDYKLQEISMSGSGIFAGKEIWL